MVADAKSNSQKAHNNSSDLPQSDISFTSFISNILSFSYFFMPISIIILLSLRKPDLAFFSEIII